MPKIVCVHGIAQEYEAPETLLEKWTPPLHGGITLAGGHVERNDVVMAFYGDVFRPAGKARGLPPYTPGDVETGLEMELLVAWAAAASGGAGAPATKGPAASLVRVVARTPFFGNLGQRFVIWYLKQVRLYLTDAAVRAHAHSALLSAVGTAEDARVIVAHSLGSVVAYEVLMAHPHLQPQTLVTLGSPLGLPVLGRRLDPAVRTNTGRPGRLAQWFNVLDRDDVVAAGIRLSSVFGEDVADVQIENGAKAHDVRPYLTARETGRAIITGLDI